MEITRNIKFNEEERDSLTRAIEICEEISEAMGDEPKNIFIYLSSILEESPGILPDMVDFGDFD